MNILVVANLSFFQVKKVHSSCHPPNQCGGGSEENAIIRLFFRNPPTPVVTPSSILNIWQLRSNVVVITCIHIEPTFYNNLNVKIFLYNCYLENAVLLKG